ncbi:glycosyl transferase family 2 [Chthoniobacter flavus Ellin428]|uniref:Glycosyl transferase family 2 n=1 Tax=Chthoniobacter flavus Ellin428 TaxID=497964 RepID=B4CWW5_9BACT|nr:glycosyltransferase family 2 protein [Chthoniobacter flavus]EDY21285.1 glycosyl transferase family 2 [Chthoniobacter flavus Ellin428]TCO84945.1 chlorobactene glucosyltransferase [Chthoniobacter flavus]
METVVLFYHVLVLAGLLFALGMVIANLACFRGLHAVKEPSAEEAPLVSILVPTRNEALNIEACVGSLLEQDYPRFELIVLDDHSEDGTGEIVRRLGLQESGDRRVISGEPLPAGWTGKGWACHQLSLAARGEFLFFTDADTTHGPGTVAASLAAASEYRADLLSAWPRLVTVTLGEKLIIPMILLLGMSLYPHWLVLLLQKFPRVAKYLPAVVRKGLGAANGQFMFFTRAGYDRIGGHAGLHDHLVEDVALGRAVTERMGEGMRLLNCESLDFSTCRMYRSFGETWEGFTKNMRAAFEDSLAGFLFIGITHCCCFLLPFVLVFTAHSVSVWLLVIAQILTIGLIRLILTARFRTSWLGFLLHPVGEVLALSIGLNSWRRMASTGVQWKGRVYQSSRGIQAK